MVNSVVYLRSLICGFVLFIWLWVILQLAVLWLRCLFVITCGVSDCVTWILWMLRFGGLGLLSLVSCLGFAVYVVDCGYYDCINSVVILVSWLYMLF